MFPVCREHSIKRKSIFVLPRLWKTGNNSSSRYLFKNIFIMCEWRSRTSSHLIHSLGNNLTGIVQRNSSESNKLFILTENLVLSSLKISKCFVELFLKINLFIKLWYCICACLKFFVKIAARSILAIFFVELLGFFFVVLFFPTGHLQYKVKYTLTSKMCVNTSSYVKTKKIIAYFFFFCWFGFWIFLGLN